MDVEAWSASLGFARYAAAFRANDVDREILLALSDAELRTLGVVSLGHRERLSAAIAALAAEPAASEGPREVDRRPVAVPFCDRVGYKRLSAASDPERVHALLQRFFATVDRLVLAHGGTIDKHIGDCVVALFGAPLAHGDDVDRAVACARAPIGAVAGLAVPGEILAAETVRRAARGTFPFREAGELALDGFDRAIRAFYLETGPPPEPAAPSTPFVGRSAELARLQGLLRSCRRAGSGRTALLRGEAGIGKSRLVRELLAGARGFRVHEALVLDFGGGRASAVAELASGLLDLTPKASPEARAEAVERVIARSTVAGALRLHLLDLAGALLPPELAALRAAMDEPTRAGGRARATGMGFVGPLVLGGLVATTVDPAERAAALAEGRALLEAGSACHNHLLFAEEAIEGCLAAGERGEVLALAEALERYTAAEPVARGRFVVDRALALVALEREGPSPALRARLAALAAEAGRVGLARERPALLALAGAPPSGEALRAASREAP